MELGQQDVCGFLDHAAVFDLKFVGDGVGHRQPGSAEFKRALRWSSISEADFQEAGRCFIDDDVNPAGHAIYLLFVCQSDELLGVIAMQLHLRNLGFVGSQELYVLRANTLARL
jgi:hypothetical protein